MNLISRHLARHVGGFFSSVLESGCVPVVGASGGIFGLIGLFIADLIMNFRTLTRFDLHDRFDSVLVHNLLKCVLHHTEEL